MQASRNPARSRPLSANVKRLMRLERASPENERVIKVLRQFTARDIAYCRKQGNLFMEAASMGFSMDNFAPLFMTSLPVAARVTVTVGEAEPAYACFGQTKAPIHASEQSTIASSTTKAKVAFFLTNTETTPLELVTTIASFKIITGKVICKKAWTSSPLLTT